jgi:protein phosphatase
MLELEFAQCSDAGRTREKNEDYFGYAQPATPAEAQSHGWLFVVADGVGGQALGEVASRTAVDSLLANFRRSAGGEAFPALLRRLVQAANQAVYEAGRSAGPGGIAIGTTVVVCALRYDRAVVAHVGDSRCYLVRNGQAAALTRDHTIAGEQLRLGLVSASEAAASGNRHVLSRSLGNDLFVNVDISDHALLPGDVLMLCSDGLHNAVPERDIAQMLRTSLDLNDAARKLVRVANERDGGDNITAQVIRVRGVERMGMYRGRPYRIR